MTTPDVRKTGSGPLVPKFKNKANPPPKWLIYYRNIKVDSVYCLVVSCGCETWSLTLREEHRMRVLENSLLRKIFGPEKDEIIGGWRKCIMRSFITFVLFAKYN
jgi:hypothetical protein